jgi:hypothetical protein
MIEFGLIMAASMRHTCPPGFQTEREGMRIYLLPLICQNTVFFATVGES